MRRTLFWGCRLHIGSHSFPVFCFWVFFVVCFFFREKPSGFSLGCLQSASWGEGGTSLLSTDLQELICNFSSYRVLSIFAVHEPRALNRVLMDGFPTLRRLPITMTSTTCFPSHLSIVLSPFYPPDLLYTLLHWCTSLKHACSHLFVCLFAFPVSFVSKAGFILHIYSFILLKVTS